MRPSTLLLLLCGTNAYAQEAHEHHHHVEPAMPESDPSVAAHVPPDPPSQTMHPMSAREMVDIMAMDDNARYGKFMVDKAEYHDDTFAWDIDAWYGSDGDKLWLKSEGELEEGQAFNIDVLWDHVFARWWSLQSGIRSVSRDGHYDQALVVGLQGLAPQWFDIDTRLALDEHGGLSLQAEAEYDLLLTQRLILQPDAKVVINSRDNIPLGIGSGVSEMAVSLRLRYEFRREFAPYIGVRWARSFGTTANLARSAGDDANDLQVLGGLRFWF
jgi:copper resistance protein B